MFLPRPLVKIQYCAEPSRTESYSVLGLRPPCLEGSASHSSHILLAQFSLNVHKGDLKPLSFHFILSFHNKKYVNFVSIPCLTAIQVAVTAFMLCRAVSKQTQDICITFVQRCPNVFDVGPTLYKCYTNVLCLLGWRLPIITLRIN